MGLLDKCPFCESDNCKKNEVKIELTYREKVNAKSYALFNKLTPLKIQRRGFLHSFESSVLLLPNHETFNSHAEHTVLFTIYLLIRLP